MKILLLAALAALMSTAAQACTPSESDFKALAESPSHLTPGEFSALTPASQNAVCVTRAFLNEVDAKKGVITEIHHGNQRLFCPVPDRGREGAYREGLR